MLPTVDYVELENPNFFSSSIVDLEYGVIRHLGHFVEDLTEILKKEKMAQTPEIRFCCKNRPSESRVTFFE